MTLPLRHLSKGCLRNLVCLVRHESSDYAISAGVSQPLPPSPFISEKLSEISENNEVVDTVSSNAFSYLNDNIIDILQPVTELPILSSYLTPESIWVPLCASAVLLRSINCCSSRVSTYKVLQRSLPHSKYFADITAKFITASRKNDEQATALLREEKAKYIKDNGVVDVNNYKMLGLMMSITLTTFYLSTLTVLSHTATEFLAQSSFFWISNMLEPDPYYVLPLTNLLFGTAVLSVDPRPPKTLNFAQSTGRFGILSAIHPFGWLMLSPFMYIGISQYCQILPSYIALFWSVSNISALTILLPLRYSDSLRRSLGLLPYLEYKNLVQRENISVAEIKERGYDIEREDN